MKKEIINNISQKKIMKICGFYKENVETHFVNKFLIFNYVFSLHVFNFEIISGNKNVFIYMKTNVFLFLFFMVV